MYESIIHKAKQKNLLLENIGFTGNTSRVYVNQELTPRMRDIFFQARLAQKKYNWKFVWQKGGRIYLRKTEGGDAISLTSKAQLDGLCN